jgi:molybdopterin molybdotransferase
MASGTASDFPVRASIEEAAAWIDAHGAPLEGEDVLLAEAAGRVLARDAVAGTDLPPFARASIDGLAVRAVDASGASAYNPVTFRLVPATAAPSPYTGFCLSAGDPVPGGADAIVPLAHIERGPTETCEVIEAVASGSGIERKASHFARGATLLKAGRRLLPYDMGLLAAAGVVRLQAIRRPRVRGFLAAPAGGSPAAPFQDANGPLLRALIERDGGTVAELRQIARDRATVHAALTAAAADVIIVAGGTGRGCDDMSAAALAEAGELAIHGMAVHPGETGGLGRTGAGLPVFLLPGMPAACLWAYEFCAGRMIRRLAGRDPALPFPVREMTTARKIVSSIGMTEVHPVRCSGHDQVEPIASFAEGGLRSAVRADGFVIIAAGSEGVPEGAAVTVHLHATGDRPPADRGVDGTP